MHFVVHLPWFQWRFIESTNINSSLFSLQELRDDMSSILADVFCILGKNPDLSQSYLNGSVSIFNWRIFPCSCSRYRDERTGRKKQTWPLHTAGGSVFGKNNWNPRFDGQCGWNSVIDGRCCSSGVCSRGHPERTTRSRNARISWTN